MASFHSRLCTGALAVCTPANNLAGGVARCWASACAAAAQMAGCFGFTTAEGSDTTLVFGFTILTKPLSNNVSEPGNIALFSLALLGPAVTRRRYSMR